MVTKRCAGWLLTPLAALAAGCGSSSTSVTSSAGVSSTSTTSTATTTPSPSPTPTTAPTRTANPAPSFPRIEAPSLGLNLPLSILRCDQFSAAGVADPLASLGYYIDCTGGGGGFYGVIGLRGGTMQPLATAVAGTVVKIFDAGGHEIDRTLDAGSQTFTQNSDGTWPGHGVPPGQPAFVELRGGGTEIERTGHA